MLTLQRSGAIKHVSGNGTNNLSVPELFLLILAHPVYKNVNNTGTKYVRIMKQTAF
jgi:hypothetical protein